MLEAQRLRRSATFAHMPSEATQSEKETLEIQKLRQELRHGRVTLYLSILGSVLLFVGVAIDRLKTHEQRKHEFELAQFSQKLSRMSSVTEEFDRLLGQTTGVLSRNRERTWQFITDFRVLQQDLDKLKATAPEIDQFRQYVDELYSKLSKSTMRVDDWADAAGVEARWDSLSRSPTPDFEHLFGTELLAPWHQLRESAVEALQAEYSFSGKHPKEKMERFRELGAAFQVQLYDRIATARKKQI
jgi:hypothetical protein